MALMIRKVKVVLIMRLVVLRQGRIEGRMSTYLGCTKRERWRKRGSGQR